MAKRRITAKTTEPLVVGGLRTGAVQLTVGRNAKADHIHAALDKIFELHGCPACGLNGLDISFRHTTPMMDAFKGFQSISAVEQLGY